MTNDLDDVVRRHVEEVIRGKAPMRPPFAGIQAAAKRRRRRRTVAAGCAALLVVGATGIGFLGVRRGSDNLTPAAGSRGQFVIPTYAYRAGDLTPSVGFEGTLQFSPDGCPFLGKADDPPGLPLAFPQGFEGHISEDGARVVLDDNGNLWATEGEALTIGQGGTLTEVQDSMSCTSGHQTDVNPLLVSPRILAPSPE